MKHDQQRRLEHGSRIARLALGKLFGALAVLVLLLVGFFAVGEWLPTAVQPRRADPRLRATPISYAPFVDNLTSLVDQAFIPPGRECRKDDRLAQELLHGEVRLTSIAESGMPPGESVHEIADSQHGTYRAYLANLDQPVFRIYLRQREGAFYELTWSSAHPNYVLRNLTWIGDQIIAFEKSFGDAYTEIIAIDVAAPTFVYFANLDNGVCQ